MSGTTRQIDVARLPSDVAALVDTLRPGEELIITRAGVPIASVCGAIGGTIVVPHRPPEDSEQPPTGRDDVTVVATAMRLPESVRAVLSAQLGTDYIVVDMHCAPTTTDVLLVPPTSPQLIGNLRSMFPQARVVIVEFEDDDLGIHYLGPIRRMLDAGADTYLTPTTIPSLARQLDETVTRRREVTGRADRDLAIEAAGAELG
ncbi:hypothetical protein [Micromonospora sp. C95]|uniref:hypothetical protein n=1 Tax=Micromonospora sp. C95 TaxID=2824882 RepID=UPI001B39C1B7|nr:hypothetical protein [Micromonospora sp. C95]MBQ1026081.1 hypothetical protein [Micromonospora sp. C95]